MGHNLAIVVGINEYERLKKLKYAKQDALKIKGFLEEHGEVESVLLFTDDSEAIDGKPTRATHTNLRDLLVSRFEEQFLNSEDNLWFFFSGHGQRHNQRDYLLPIDGNPRDIDGTGITIDFVTDRLSRSGAGNVVLILDACRNALTGAKGGGELGHEATERVRERGLISIFSCHPDEQSWEEDALGQGIFTFALMKALLEGRCATAWQINSYLKNEVTALVKQYGKPPQTPYLVAQPIEKTHLILVLKNTKEDDLDRLKKTALELEAEENFDSALELWNRVNIAAQGKDAQFYSSFKRIERRRQRELLGAKPLSTTQHSASVSTHQTPSPKPDRTQKTTLVAAAILVVALVVGAAFYFGLRSPSRVAPTSSTATPRTAAVTPVPTPLTMAATPTPISKTPEANAPLSVVRHSGRVLSAVLSPDSKRILTGSDDETASLWDTNTGQHLVTFGAASPVTLVKFNSEGTRLLTVSHQEANSYDVQSGQRLTRFFEHADQINSAEFSPNSKYVLTGSEDRTAKLWDAVNGNELGTYQHGDAVKSAVFAPDGKEVLTVGGDYAKLWDAATRKLLATFHHQGINSAVFSRDGTLVVTGGDDDSARIWDSKTWKQLVELHADFEVQSAIFSPDGSRVLTTSYTTIGDSNNDNNTADLWDAKTGKHIASFCHDDEVRCAMFSPDGQRILTAGLDETPRLWDARSGKQITVFEHEGYVNSAVFSQDGRLVLTGSDDGTAKVWDTGLSRSTALNTDVSLPLMVLGAFTSAVFSPDGKFILTTSDDHAAKVWDAEQIRAPLHVLQCDTGLVSAEYSSDGKRILTVDGDGAKLWDAKYYEKLISFGDPKYPVQSARFSPDGTRVVTASLDHTAKVWDARSGKVLDTFQHDDRVNQASFSPDGTRVVTASSDHTAKVWDARSGKVLDTFQHDDGVNQASFSPDGTRVVTEQGGPVLARSNAKLWDAATGKQINDFADDEYWETIVFSADSSRFLTCDSDQTIKVWNARTGKIQVAFRLHNLVADCKPVFSADGSRIVVATAHSYVGVFNAQSGEPLMTLRHNPCSRSNADVHGHLITSATINLNNTRILTADSETAKVWEVTK